MGRVGRRPVAVEVFQSLIGGAPQLSWQRTGVVYSMASLTCTGSSRLTESLACGGAVTPNIGTWRRIRWCCGWPVTSSPEVATLFNRGGAVGGNDSETKRATSWRCWVGIQGCAPPRHVRGPVPGS